MHNLAMRCVQDGSKQYGITAGLLMCFMTELGPQGAEECLQQVPALIRPAQATCKVDIDTVQTVADLQITVMVIVGS